MRIRIDAKQLIVVNMLTCLEVPGGGTFASQHSSDENISRRVHGGNNFEELNSLSDFRFNENTLRANPFIPRRVTGGSNSVVTPLRGKHVADKPVYSKTRHGRE